MGQTGKDPLAAVLAAVEFLGPCRFGGWLTERDENRDLEAGDPYGVEHQRAWIQIVAVSQKQPLALDTRVPTPVGFRELGEIGVGDVVFDHEGRQVVVARETEVFHGEDCYRLTFDDGTSVVATGEHGWTVEQVTPHGDRVEQVNVTTERLAQTYARRRVRIPLVPRLTEPAGNLKIDPYLLGLWLGDGNKANAGITTSFEDAPAQTEQIALRIDPTWEVRRTDRSARPGQRHVELFVGRRKDLCPRGHHKRENPIITQFGHPVCRICQSQRNRACLDPVIPSLHELLREEGVLNNKHVPERYLLAGTEQRRALLQGLLDSDGGVIGRGRVCFTNVNRNLIDAVKALAESLGNKPFVAKHSTSGWVVTFQARGDEPLFRLARKQRAVVSTAQPFRYLRTVERVESVPTKCIGIDTPEHLFQVEGGLLTRNTKNTMLLMNGLFSDRLKTLHGMTKADFGKEIIYAYGGSRQIETVTSSPTTLEGNRPTFIIRNETHHWKDSNAGTEMYEAIDRNAAKSKGGRARALSITNAYDPSDASVAQKQRESWEDVQSGQNIDVGVLYDSIEAPKSTSLLPPGVEEPTDDQVKAWIESVVDAVKGDASWLSAERITQSVLDGSIKPSTSRRFYFNTIVNAEDAAFDADAIDAAAEVFAVAARDIDSDALRAGWLAMPDEPVVMFFDGSLSDDATALVGVRLSDGYAMTFGVWQKPPKARAGQGWRAPRADVDIRVQEVFGRFNIVAFWADPSHTLDDDGTRYWDSTLDAWHQRYKDRLQLWAIKTGDRQHAILWDMASPERTRMFTEAVMQFKQELEHRDEVDGPFTPEVIHDGHPLLVKHLKNAKKIGNRFGNTIWKGGRESPHKIDLAVCLIAARMLRRALLNRGLEEVEEPAGEIWGC